MTPISPGGGLLGYCGHAPVLAASTRVPCPSASAIEATSSMPVAKLGVADCASQQSIQCSSGQRGRAIMVCRDHVARLDPRPLRVAQPSLLIHPSPNTNHYRIVEAEGSMSSDPSK